MKKYSVLALFTLIVLLSGCLQKDNVTPINATDVVGKWQVKNMKIILKGNDNGKIETFNESRNGTAAEVLDIKSNGTINDPSDLFGTGTYGWQYTIKGNELALGEPGDIAYFTLSINGNSMTWHMNIEQTNRALNDSDGFNSVLNVDVDEARGKILENDFTIEFVKK